MGFGTHPHRDMEILTYVVSGQLQHRDSVGNGRIIEAGELQAMSAGKGITHSEFNPSRTEPAHFLQIWIQPREKGLTPSYGELKPASTPAALTVLASPDARDGSLLIHQDALLLLGNLSADESVTHRTDASRGVWVQVISGSLRLDGETLTPGDSARLEDAAELTLTAAETSKFLVFDLA
ncbi:MAG: pirin family protein, partial [Chthoniobacteraceae bacterium]